MKISELAEASGASIPTIKYYIREGLLPAGTNSSRTQARYSEEHVRRLDLIAILRTELGMPVERIGEVLRAAGQGGEAMLALGLKHARETRRAVKAVAPGAGRNTGADVNLAAVPPELDRARRLVRRMAKSLGWKMEPGSFLAEDVAESVATILRSMPEADIASSLDGYARAMKAIADREIPDTFDPAAEPWESLRYAVLGTYLFEPLLLALRRLAHAGRAADLARGRKRGSASGGRNQPGPIP